MIKFRDILPRSRWLVTIIVVFTSIVLIAATNHYRKSYSGDLAFPSAGDPTSFSTNLAIKDFVKPDKVKVVALIFFGRKDRVELLRCYLERNLVDNGGWLDEVHWVVNTDKKDDLTYLEEILKDAPRYKKIDLTSEGIGYEGYGHAWGHVERGSVYIKIDDDVVYFADDTIPRIVSLKLQNPNYLVTSANVINSPLMGWVHFHAGAMRPYLPELNVWEPGKLDAVTHKSWKYSDYPNWTGPADYFFDFEQDPPYDGHRWLRLPDDSDIHRTPVETIEYDTWGRGLKSWAVAAQEHYSFLENLAEKRLDRYKFNKAWITDYKRLSINMICVLADDILDNLPMDAVDEEWLTVNLPKKLKKSVAVETDALATHFTFGPQGKVGQTDLLLRYRDYATENACQRRVNLGAHTTA